MDNNFEDVIELRDEKNIDSLFGSYDENIILLQKECGVRFILRGNILKIVGEEKNVSFAKEIVRYILKNDFFKKNVLDKQSIEFILDCFKNDKKKLLGFFKEKICLNYKNKVIFTKTYAQKEYSDLISKNIITFGVGVAGTGKTYVAVTKAVFAFNEKLVEKIVITRPVVETGERLGFLPGDLQSKIDPYLRPIYDVLEEIIGLEKLNKLIERKKIEIVPLAYMRGRTLSSSFIILDEAQNTTRTQMKMFLTRLGNGSKMVVTGDVTQIDLVNKKESGLLSAIELLKDIEDIAVMEFDKRDVVRHELVRKIIKAYEM